jgi:hypothetical protein
MEPLASLHLQMRLEGKQVVRAWARSLLEAGKVPFYSHKIESRASACSLSSKRSPSSRLHHPPGLL